jgi:hypothetical protein
MIGYVDIKKSIIDVLKIKASAVKVVANEELSGFNPPAFFVQVIPINDTPYLDYEEKLITITIHYFSVEKTDLANLKMLDQLNGAFFHTLKLGDRIITLGSKNPQILDNVLQFKFSLEFTNDVDVEELNGEWVMVTKLDKTLGYAEENVELMQELEYKED